MEANKIKFRCSSLGYLMTKPRNKSEMISETTKTHLVDVYVSNQYNRFTEISGKQLDKGNEVEEDSITVISRITKTFLKKNEQSLENEFIKGTPDLFIGKSIHEAEIIRDAKSSWDIYTFNRAKHKELSENYKWQVKGYMALTGAKEAYVDYCLNNTPYHILNGELMKESYKHHEGNTPNWIELQIISNHVYDYNTFKEYVNIRGCNPVDEYSKAVYEGFVEVPLEERHHAFYVEYNQNDIDMLYHKIEWSRKWMNENLFKTTLITV